jgi:predicted lipid-binding transport protein (Tim44 family)
VDLLPGIHPIGLLDDAFLTGLLIYFLKNGRMPAFVLWLGRMIFGGKIGETGSEQKPYGAGEGVHQEKTEGAHARQPHAKDPFEILGIHPGASKEEIHAAYRKLSQQYHPDKVAHLGQEFQELAKEKFVEIQAAYDYLRDQ